LKIKVSQRNAVTHLGSGGSINHLLIANLLLTTLVKVFSKAVNICKVTSNSRVSCYFFDSCGNSSAVAMAEVVDSYSTLCKCL